MEHQDFKIVVFDLKTKKNSSLLVSQINSKKQATSSKLGNNNEVIKIQVDKKLGQLLSQARLAKGFKTQGDFIKELNQKTNLNISPQIYSKWESNKEAPTNEQIAKMEKVLIVKLPRNKKIKIDN